MGSNGSVDWFQEPDTYGEGYATAAAMANASARPGGLGARSSGLATYGVPGLAQAPGGVDALPGPGASSSWIAAHQLPGYGQPYGMGAVVAPYTAGASASAASASSASPATSASSSAAAAASSASPTAGVDAAFRWVLAWVVLLVLVILAIRTQLGYRLVYYSLALILLFLLLTNYQWLASALAPFQEGAQQPGGLLG